MFYSKSTGGFYHPEIHGAPNIPEDAVEVSDAEYAMLVSSGKQIVGASNGRPVISDKTTPMPIHKADAVKLMASSLVKILNNEATTHSFASIEDACSFTDGPFASDGQFFRDLRSHMRTHLLRLTNTLTDVQDMSDITTLVSELRQRSKDYMTGFVASNGDANGS